MEQVTTSGAIDRPRVVVSVGTSVDERVTLRRHSLLMNEDASRLWRSLWPPSAQALEAAGESQFANLYQPQAVLEGSGSLVTDSVGPLAEPCTDFNDPPNVLHTDFLPEEVLGRPGHERWFPVVDSRGRVRWR